MGKLSEIFSAAADLIRSVSGTKTNKFTSAIIVAGGLSSRFGGDTTKQMTEVCGIPVIVHTLLAFEKSDRISEIIVSAKEDEIQMYDCFAKEYGITKLTKTVVGGQTRAESVLNGFEATSPKADFVAIHDGARCLITTEDIEKVLDSAIKYGAATASVSVFDTVKIVDKNGFIKRTEDRDLVRLAQTPQIFKRNLYCAAAYTAREEGFECTDDNMLVEKLGFPVKAVDCNRDNFKVTLAEDILKAETIFEKRKALEDKKCSE
ncbi:MAG: 2-C-methyl-D-erythritol 4-phosphate cytidylyltransferase [Clostridia bacterium]|nr:2-C-methyl-D-erythritol 4-phosphate cytidylyltransferase [Clostridia bacterium]